MIENVIAVKPEQTPHDVVEIPKHNRIRRVVVCDDENRVQGMITRSELVRVFSAGRANRRTTAPDAAPGRGVVESQKKARSV
ncbi:MAG TPA: CBS domain-containing protein [Gammaproteobacteria bacterium]